MNINTFYSSLDLMFKTKNIKEIEIYILESLEKAKAKEDVPAILAISNELGGIYRVTNRFEDGKAVYALALEAVKVLGMENTEQHGTTLLNLASLQAEEKNLEEALRLYKQVADIFEKSGMQKDYRLAALYNNISHVYDKLDQDNEALEFAEKSLQIIKNIPEQKIELATTYTTYALRLIKVKRFSEAKENLVSAEEIFLKLPGKKNVHYSATLNGMGELFYYEGKLKEAEECFVKALDIIRDNYGENKAYENVYGNLEKLKIKTKKRKTGLEISRDFYNEYGKNMIHEKFPEYEKYMAVGLVGEGSECFGFDDEISEDHDFHPGFCIWVPDEIFNKIGASLQLEYKELENVIPKSNSITTREAAGRRGIFSIEGFYKKYIGTQETPKDNVEWIFANEIGLSTATNGEIFIDNLGEFTKIREELLKFYPKDIFLKKIVARMAMMSQAGQYNYIRSIKRDDKVAAYLATSEFIKATASIVYLLNRKYTPFYKWMLKGMDDLGKLFEIKKMLEKLVTVVDDKEGFKAKERIIEEICIAVKEELIRQNIMVSNYDFLASNCQSIMESIEDTKIKNLPIIFNGN